ncbi:MAG: hypothetical protein VZR54_08285 [Ruminococcus sp.]|jgi:hypothetical protein|nr:hypothetical protein [Ruminococcus sp.]
MWNFIKKYIVYAIIIALIYLVMPVFFQGENYRYDAIEYQFVFPATSLLCGVAYSWKRGVDFTFPLIAPIIYIGSVLIYSHFYHWAIYVFIYLIVGMLGCFIGDMVYKNNQAEKRRKEKELRRENDDYQIKISEIKIEKK